MNLYQIIPAEGLADAIAAGHVKRQFHATEPLAILNYTATCMWDRAWTPVTRACRGIIYRTDTLEVVARPFRKFFNHGEPEAGTLDANAPCVCADKMDGSLGILYPLPSGGHAIATRGSFQSEQAQRATALWRERYADRVTVPPGVTLLAEIVYPANRIVLNYGDLDDLVYLAAVDIATGRTVPFADWPGPRATVFAFATLAEALRAPPRPNAEGLVLHFPETDERVKLKQDDYVALHRIMTGTSPRRLWEYLCVDACKGWVREPKHWQRLGLDPARAESVLAAGPDWQETMLAAVPDEFYGWVRDTIAEIRTGVATMRQEIEAAFARLAPWRGDRKVYAAMALLERHPPAMFALVDGREIETYLWKQAYPAAAKAGSGWLNRSEDVA